MSNEIDLDEMLGRQSGLLKEGAIEILKETKIVVIGAGAIGSWLAFSLAKMGCENVFFCDDDVIEEANYSNQIYHLGNMDDLKVEALSDCMKLYSPVTDKWQYANKRITADNLVNGEIIISAVDSIKVRQELFDAYRWNEDSKLWLDGRIGRTIANCFCVQLEEDEAEYYGQVSLFPGQSVADIPCTEKTFISPCMFCASFISSAIWAYANGAIEKFPYNTYVDSRFHKYQTFDRNKIKEAALCL